MNKDDGILAHDILKAINLINSFVIEFDLTRFVEDGKTHSAVAYQLQIIGEAAFKISSKFKITHPDIPWQDMIDTRHKIVHHYMDIDLEIVWDVIKKDLPKLKTQIHTLLKT